MFLRRLINVLSNIDNIITLRITLAFAEWRFCDSLAAAGCRTALIVQSVKRQQKTTARSVCLPIFAAATA